jgi:hypothetical protein
MPQPALSQVPGNARAKWLAARSAELLPVPNFNWVPTSDSSACSIPGRIFLTAVLALGLNALVSDVFAKASGCDETPSPAAH